MRRYCLCLLLLLPLQARAGGELLYEQAHHSEAQRFYGLGINYAERFQHQSHGLLLTHIPGYHLGTEGTGYTNLYLYAGQSGRGIIAPFYEAGVDMATLILALTDMALSANDGKCTYDDYGYASNNYDCQTQQQSLFELRPNLFFTWGVKLDLGLGQMALFMRHYWMDNGEEQRLARFAGLRYSLRF